MPWDWRRRSCGRLSDLAVGSLNGADDARAGNDWTRIWVCRPPESFHEAVRHPQGIGQGEGDMVIPVQRRFPPEVLPDGIEEQGAEERPPTGVTSRSWYDGRSNSASMPYS